MAGYCNLSTILDETERRTRRVGLDEKIRREAALLVLAHRDHTVEEVARSFGVSDRTLRRWANRPE